MVWEDGGVTGEGVVWEDGGVTGEGGGGCGLGGWRRDRGGWWRMWFGRMEVCQGRVVEGR